MYASNRHTLVSVGGTVLMVVLTVVLAAWSPQQPARTHHVTTSANVVSTSLATGN